MTYRGYKIVFGGLENNEPFFLIYKGQEIFHTTKTVGKAIEIIDDIYTQSDIFSLEQRRELWRTN